MSDFANALASGDLSAFYDSGSGITIPPVVPQETTMIPTSGTLVGPSDSNPGISTFTPSAINPAPEAFSLNSLGSFFGSVGGISTSLGKLFGAAAAPQGTNLLSNPTLSGLKPGVPAPTSTQSVLLIGLIALLGYLGFRALRRR
jgi:hypothetical protein